MKPNPGMTIVGGLVATPAMTVLTFVLAPMLGDTDIVSLLGQTLGGWRTGMLVHILNGAILFPLVFVYVFYRVLPGATVVKGTVFGVLLWLASELIAMPLMGAGLFSMHIGGARAAIASLIGHLLYGTLLGWFPSVVQEYSASTVLPRPSSNRS